MFFHWEMHMHLTYCAFFRVGYLHAAAPSMVDQEKSRIRLNSGEVASWLRTLPSCTAPFLRGYWYDGAYDPPHHKHVDQRRHFDMIAATPGLQLRLGHLQVRAT